MKPRLNRVLSCLHEPDEMKMVREGATQIWLLFKVTVFRAVKGVTGTAQTAEFSSVRFREEKVTGVPDKF